MSSGPLNEAPEQATTERPAPPVRLSRGPRVLLGVAAGLIALVTAVQLAAIFLESAPPNTVTQRYHGQLMWWVRPLFQQNWKLFAPDPQTANTTIAVRTRSANGTVGAWQDLTAIDYAAVLHDPMPSHANENELRMAWSAYNSAPQGSAEQSMMRQYLANIALQRVIPTDPGPITALQFKVTTTPMPQPGSHLPVSPETRDVPWWTLGDSREATV